MMIFNFSLIYLNIQYSSLSPYLVSSQISNHISNNFQHLNINNFLSTFFYANRLKPNSNNQQLLYIKESNFKNILSTVISLSSYDETHNGEIFTAKLRLPQQYDNVILSNCCFLNCKRTPATNFDGSAIYIQIRWCRLFLTSCIFINNTGSEYGGAICTEGQGFNISSSIFTECSCEKTGMAIFANLYKRQTANNMESHYREDLFTKCTGEYNVLDVNTTEISISTTNVTYNTNTVHNSATSPVQYCCGIPFLFPQSDLIFTYMNIIGNDGDFVIHFDQKPNAIIHSVNIISNFNLNYFFIYDTERQLNSPSHHEMVLTNFAFFNNKARSESDGIKIVNKNSIMKFNLVDCIFDYSKDELNIMLDGESESGGQYGLSLSPGGNGYTYTQIALLIKPSICAIPSDFFTPSLTFSESEIFTGSKIFSSTSKFTKSECFSYSEKFTSSITFSKSSSFSLSSCFTHSLAFSHSDKFSSSKEFSHSKMFTHSKVFSSSSTFSKSSSFSLSSCFTHSLAFLSSDKFSSSKEFSHSKMFTYSKVFSSSSTFSKSSSFSLSSCFTHSLTFSHSDKFSSSKEFSHSTMFTHSKVFSSSSTFSNSLPFTSSLAFKPSLTFSRSNKFSPSESFTSSKKFSLSFLFTLSSIFTNSGSFSPSLNVLPTSLFSPSNSFTLFLSTATFTPSGTFTASRFFTPKKTRIPDPQNIFHQAQISGKNNIFTKEELKKAAVPASISFVFIIVSIVFCVFYLRHKLKELKNRDNIPEFDTSLTDETDIDTDYSYSYYTYTYSYVSNNDSFEYDNSSSYPRYCHDNNDSDYSDFMSNDNDDDLEYYLILK